MRLSISESKEGRTNSDQTVTNHRLMLPYESSLSVILFLFNKETMRLTNLPIVSISFFSLMSSTEGTCREKYSEVKFIDKI